MEEAPRSQSAKRPVKVSSRLLEPTQANVNGAYRKPSVEQNSNESKWSYGVKSSPKATTSNEEKETPSRSPARKVSVVSSRLLEPTKANEHGKYKAPDAVAVPPVRISPRNTQVSEHLLTPTKAVENHKYKSSETSTTFKVTPKSYTVSDHLLSPTKATENGAYKKKNEKRLSDAALVTESY